MITKKESNMWYVMKAFAILFVVMAHMTFTGNYHIAEIIRTSIGQIGVVIFFVSSGYFYLRNPHDSKKYWTKKTKTLFVPWLIMSTAIFILSALLFGAPDNVLFAYFKNFFGVGTVYWYMTTITVMLMIFRFINKDILLYTCMTISVISIAMSAMGIIKYTDWFNQYLNVFNWVGFFALGVLVRKYNLVEKMINNKIALISLIGAVVTVVVAVIKGATIEAYIDFTSLFIELFGLVLILNLSIVLANNKLLIDIGKKSFFIYLMHIQIVGAINTRLPYNVTFFILRPFIGLAVCYIITVLFSFILSKLRLEKIEFIFGLNR